MADVAPKPQVVVDHFTGKKFCHRFYIPFDVQIPEQDKLNPAVVNMKVNAQIANVACVGAKCALWNDSRKECLDVSALKAQMTTAHHLHLIGELIKSSQDLERMHSHEG